MIRLHSVYKNLWKCRDIEIQMLLSRLTLLGAFMALTYTGYGVLLIKCFDQIKNWNLFHLFAIGICCFGLIFAVLWTLTAKGSKMWYEMYERAIGYFQEVNADIFEPFKNGRRILSYADFGTPEIFKLDKFDYSPLSLKAGGFSVSKIPIVMGELSIVAWGMLSILHTLAIWVGKANVVDVVNLLGLKIAVAIIAYCGLAAVLIWLSSYSTFTTGKQENSKEEPK